MAKQTWFPHELDSTSDIRIQMLISKLGGAGYGLFWRIVEELYKLDGDPLPDSEAIVICQLLGVDDHALSVLSGIGLLANDGDGYYSRRVLEEIQTRRQIEEDYRKQQSDKGKKGMASRWGKKAASEDDNQSITDDNSVIVDDNSVITDDNKNNLHNITLHNIDKKDIDITKIDNDKSFASSKNILLEAGSEASSESVFSLPLNDGSGFEVTASYCMKLSELYPSCDVIQELRNMAGWLISNPRRRKTASGIKRFINAWLSREQNSPRCASGSGYASKAESIARSYDGGTQQQWADYAAQKGGSK